MRIEFEDRNKLNLEIESELTQEHFELLLEIELRKINYKIIEPDHKVCRICRDSAEDNEYKYGMCCFCLNDFEHPFIWV